MRRLTFILLVLLLVLSACSGKDKADKDTTAPIRPKMIPHLGDTGDGIIIYDEQEIELNDDNNGIDAVPDGNMIKISWEPFQDTDLSHLDIYRFSDLDAEPVLLDKISANRHYYLDQSPLVERVFYSYYIELFDSSGNSAVSDTVSYAILAKPPLVSPADNYMGNPDGVRFSFNRADDRAGWYRILFFDEENHLLWHQDIQTIEEEPISVQYPIDELDLPLGTRLRWRVDYFDWDDIHQLYMGSESVERSFTIALDTTPPASPALIPHLGDTGDGPVMYNGVSITLNEENNGIDAVPYVDGIRVMWEPFTDIDLSYAVLRRYSAHGKEDNASWVFTPDITSFVDEGPLDTTKRYYYQMQLFDKSGNSSFSNEVSYRLLEKIITLQPEDGAVVSLPGLQFQWKDILINGGVTRFLLWDEQDNLIYKADMNAPGDDYDPPYYDGMAYLVLPNDFPYYPSGARLKWRLDLLKYDSSMGYSYGSESAEKTIIVE